MTSSLQPKRRDGVLTTSNVFVQALDIVKDACGVPSAQVAFDSVSTLLTIVRVRFILP